MRIRITLLAIGCAIAWGLLLAISYQPQGSVTTPKSDRLVGQRAPADFLTARFG
ncbi:hypothetical protein FHX15_004164 [Rhizobium sp. BK650]|uniref:hypothetical protein n=1 Tax=Rhizobium sp. BK650 TaxID=2586990 RepID=UPI001617780A|nr:hypothetical protein [Rhizobium sp. BK650]MBB3658904.1 hypothetical protein [Rhizobium sp. BK650]